MIKLIPFVSSKVVVLSLVSRNRNCLNYFLGIISFSKGLFGVFFPRCFSESFKRLVSLNFWNFKLRVLIRLLRIFDFNSERGCGNTNKAFVFWRIICIFFDVLVFEFPTSEAIILLFIRRIRLYCWGTPLISEPVILLFVCRILFTVGVLLCNHEMTQKSIKTKLFWNMVFEHMCMTKRKIRCCF